MNSFAILFAIVLFYLNGKIVLNAAFASTCTICGISGVECEKCQGCRSKKGGRMCCNEVSEAEGLRCVVQDVIRKMKKYRAMVKQSCVHNLSLHKMSKGKCSNANFCVS